MNRVAIIGTVPVSKRVAPYDDKSWDIWVCSPGNSQAGAPPRIDKWFELHSLVDMRGPENANWCPQYYDWLNKQQFPIYMQERNDDVPGAIQFPRDILLEKFGPSKERGRTNWFTSSIAWMMAYAIHLGVKEIGIFGVDMAATEEHYSWQKAGCLRFIEIAREHGVTVTIPLESTLACGAPLYGYAESSRMGRSLIVREFEMKDNIARLERQQNQNALEISFFKGALEDISFIRRTFVNGLEDAEIDVDDKAVVELMADKAHQVAAVMSGSEVAIQNFDTLPGSNLLVPRVPVERTEPPSAEDFTGMGAGLLPKRKSRAKRKVCGGINGPANYRI